MRRFELGWDAPSFKEQFPELSDYDAAHFDLDNDALTRMRIRGYMTDSARNSAIKKIGKALERSLAKGGKVDG